MKRWKTGLSLNEQGWGLVQLRTIGDEERFECVQRGEWRSDEPGARGMELRRICLEHRVSSPITVSVTAHAVLWTTLELPLVSEKDIEAVIQGSWEELRALEAPFIAYEVLNRSERLQVRASAIDRRVLSEWMDLLENAGVEPDGMILQAQAVCRALLHSVEPSFFIITGQNLVEMGVASQGIPVFLRTIPWSKTGAEDIQQELGFTRHAWLRQGGTPPQSLLAFPPDVFAEETWGNEMLIPPKTHGCLEGHLSFVAAYGAAIFEPTGVTWRPSIASMERRNKLHLLALGGATIAFLLVGAFGFHRAQLQATEIKTRWVQSNLTLTRELERLEAQDEQMIAEIARRQNLWNQRRFYSEALQRWQTVVPPETVLTHWMLEGSKVVELSGRTPTISRLIEVLGKDPVFKGLALKGSVYHNPKGWDEFRLTGDLREEALHGDKMGSGE